jgi:hypothetical protein
MKTSLTTKISKYFNKTFNLEKEDNFYKNMSEYWNIFILPLKEELLIVSDEVEEVHGSGPSEDAMHQGYK